MSKKDQVKAHWGNAKKISQKARLELQLALGTEQDDPRYLAILEAFRDASNYQRHIDHKRQFSQTKEELRRTLTKIRNGLLKAQKSIAELSRESERRLDWFSSIRKNEESPFQSEFSKFQAVPYNERKNSEFHSGFSILLDEMEQTVEYYLKEIPSGKPKKHQYSMAIRDIARVFQKQFPDNSLMINKFAGEQTIFFKVISIWFYMVEKMQPEVIGSVRRKIEAAMENYTSDK